MTYNANIFSAWRAAMDNTWFTTRSPYPELPCYISPMPLMSARNDSSYLSMNAPISDIQYYLEQQVLRLKYNNPNHTPFMVEAVITTRIAYWRCNDVLRRDAYYLGELLHSIIEECFGENCTSTIEYFDITKYWYSDEIMQMSADGSKSSERYKAKLEARRAVISEGYKDDFRVATHEYKADNFNVLPTVKILSNNTGRSREIINVHGKEFIISQLDNTKQRVQKVREFYPELTQKKVAEILAVSLVTVKRYWRM